MMALFSCISAAEHDHRSAVTEVYFISHDPWPFPFASRHPEVKWAETTEKIFLTVVFKEATNCNTFNHRSRVCSSLSMCVFLDTHGHEAFGAMRARGARVTSKGHFENRGRCCLWRSLRKGTGSI